MGTVGRGCIGGGGGRIVDKWRGFHELLFRAVRAYVGVGPTYKKLG